MADRWRDLLTHDGSVVVRLRLLTSGEGGRDRAVQSGSRAEWLLPGDATPTAAPVDLVGGLRSLAPGAEGLVRAYPMEPQRWHDLAPGTVIDLAWTKGRRLGFGVVEAVEDVPAHLRRRAG